MTSHEGQERLVAGEGDTSTPTALEKEVGASLRILLRAAYSQLTEQERVAAFYEVGFVLSLDVEQYNRQARTLLQSPASNIESLSTDPFKNAIKTFLPHEQEIKPLEHNLNEHLARTPENPS